MSLRVETEQSRRAHPTPPLPAILIAGFGGAGKRQTVEALLCHKPAYEQWALIAQAGLLGGARWNAGATNENPPPGLVIETVAPGCPCCTGLTPFSTGLVALLRKLRDKPVTRLLIEGGSEGHVDSVARLLGGDQFRAHVTLAHVLAVIDPAWLANPQPAAQAALAELAGAAGSLVAAPWNENAQLRSEFRDFAGRCAPSRPWTVLEGGRLEADYVRAVLSTQTFQGTR